MSSTCTESALGSTATGRGVRIAVVDSGVHASHPHVGGVAGGVAIGSGRFGGDFIDRIGHGTAVTAAIKEKAPDAAIYAVRIFDTTLTTNIMTLTSAVRWAVDAGMRIVNLSLGTANPAHREELQQVVRAACDSGTIIVAARDDGGVAWLPGSLPGVVPVQVDWDCPRDCFSIVATETEPVLRTSGYPRQIPGVSAARNLSGISFAVANATGLIARHLERFPETTIVDLLSGMSRVGDGDRGQHSAPADGR